MSSLQQIKTYNILLIFSLNLWFITFISTLHLVLIPFSLFLACLLNRDLEVNIAHYKKYIRLEY